MYKDENMELSRDEIDIPEEKKDSQGTVKETKAEEKERRISEFRQHLKNKKTISQNEISDYFCEIEMDSEEMDDIYTEIFSVWELTLLLQKIMKAWMKFPTKILTV